MNFNQELRDFAASLKAASILEDTNPIIDFLEDTFAFVGSKISLKGESNYCDFEFQDWNVQAVAPFFEAYSHVKEVLTSSKEIVYLGDGATDVGLLFEGREFVVLLDFLMKNIPEHHYFFSIKDKWCLLVAMEGYVEFGEKQAG